MDDEEIQLPALPQMLTDSALPRPTFLRLNSRKRSTRSDELQDEDDAFSNSLHTSSDPALFSSDETPDAENYAGGKRRRKKTYTGTWWGQKFSRSRSRSAGLSSNASSRKVGKRKFTRNFDSGIFMHSDDASTELSSDSSLANELMETQRRDEERKSLEQLPSSPVRRVIVNVASPSPQRKRAFEQSTRSGEEQHAVMIIRECLEVSKEDVDLSGLSLQTVPLEIRQLATMVKDDPGYEIHFDSLVARPRLYLSNNLLRELPSPVLELSNLRLLSLRQNKLTRLPAGIRNLVKLETLNISGNKLKFLPVEILDLLSHHRLSEIHSDPNPWLEPTVAEVEASMNSLQAIDRPVVYREARGNRGKYTILCSLTAISEPQANLALESSDHLEQSRTLRFPQLSEFVLRQLAMLNTSKRDLSALMPEHTPPTVIKLLKELHAVQEEGGHRCVKCARDYVIPAKSWIEWRTIHLKTHTEETITSQRERIKSSSDSHKTRSLPFILGTCGCCGD